MQVVLHLRPQGLRQARSRADEPSVAILSRPLSLYPRVLRMAATLAAALLLPLVLLATPAGAIDTTVGSTSVGLQPRSTSLATYLFENPTGPVELVNPGGNPIVSANKTYAIYWDPTDHYHGDWQEVIDRFFQSMGSESGSLASVFAVDAQYTDAANEHALYKSTFQGAYTDSNAYPASSCADPHPLEAKDRIGPIVAGQHTEVCLTDKQIQEELERFIAQHALQKGLGAIFYMMTPLGVTVCLDGGGLSGHCSDYHRGTYIAGETEPERKAKEAEEKASYEKSFCSYHSDISLTNPTLGDANTILYGVIPWTAGGLSDGHLTPADDFTPAFDCQDGGFDPSGKPIEQREKSKEVKKNKKTEEEEPLTKEEEEKRELKKALEGPHQQEPNQVPCPSPDGYCDTGLADLIVNQIAVEQQNIVTNPLLDGWHDPNKNEATDECRNFFAPVIGGGVSANEETGAGTLYNQVYAGKNYYLNDAFNRASQGLPYPAIPCISGVRLEPQFTVPNPVNANEIVGFDGMESDITLNAGTSFSPTGEAKPSYSTYTWDFGDGSAPVSGVAPGAPSANSPAVSPCVSPWEAPCAASAYHSYQYGGSYEVTLTVTDVGGNTAKVTHKLTVDGPPAPSSNNGGGTGGGGTGGGATTTSPVAPTSPLAQAPGPPPTPAPVLGAALVSKSLKKALSSGLPVRYTANEQVAGSIQVLLDGAVAKRLGVHGATATGLPAGTPRSIVVGSAVLITTKAGQGTLHIKFSARTAAHLRHVRKLKLMLRLFARNASRVSPQTTTVLSTVVLNP
jgi:hypothetical protein